jgi:A/G-specific adenine glycosylase
MNGGDPTLRELHRRLLAWYGDEARELPWRRTTDPYAIWVSEVMLQQTRVETVLRYYDRFLRRFPDVEQLAAASLDDVLKAWEGLGYYRRARNLHRAARQVVEEHDGIVPDGERELACLPGIGAYTAAAVASIAFGRPEPAVDGNVIRVLSRIFRIGGESQRAATRKAIGTVAKALCSLGSSSEVNQAMMDLGARLCRPRSPRCQACPVAGQCAAHAAGEEMLYPQRRPRQPIPHVEVVGGLIWDAEPFGVGARLLISKRHEEDMLGGLWEFPGGRVEDGESREEALVRELREELAIDVEVGALFMQLDHAYTHFRITLFAYHCRHTGGEPQALDCADWAWVDPGQLATYAFPTADRRILERIEAIAGGDRD